MEIRRVLLAALILISVGAAGAAMAAAPAAAAPRSGDEGPQPAATRPATGPVDEAERAVERAERAAIETAAAMYEELLKGPERPSPELMYQWSKRMDGGFGMPDWGKHLERMRRMLAEEEALHTRGAVPRSNVLAYRYFVAEAEIHNAMMNAHWQMLKGMRDPSGLQTPPRPDRPGSPQ